MRMAVKCAVLIALTGALPQPGGRALSARPGPGPDLVYFVIPQDSRIEFHATSSFGKVTGVFHDWRAELKRPGRKFEDTSLKLEIESASVKTGNGLRDKEVKGKSFFAVKQYPEIVFVSKSIVADGEPAKYRMEGELTLRGITQPVSIAVAVHPEEKGRERVEGSFSFNRRDFGMTHNPPLNHVANTISVQIALEVEEREGTL